MQSLTKRARSGTQLSLILAPICLTSWASAAQASVTAPTQSVAFSQLDPWDQLGIKLAVGNAIDALTALDQEVDKARIESREKRACDDYTSLMTGVTQDAPIVSIALVTGNDGSTIQSHLLGMAPFCSGSATDVSSPSHVQARRDVSQLLNSLEDEISGASNEIDPLGPRSFQIDYYLN